MIFRQPHLSPGSLGKVGAVAPVSAWDIKWVKMRINCTTRVRSRQQLRGLQKASPPEVEQLPDWIISDTICSASARAPVATSLV